MSTEFIMIIILSLLVVSISGFVLIYFLRRPSSVQQVSLTQEINTMRTELERVSGLIQILEKDRHTQFGEITTQLKATNEQTSTTAALREALANSRARGQWGERMAEDI